MELYVQIDGSYWFFGKGDVLIVDLEEFRVDFTMNEYAYNIRGASSKVVIQLPFCLCIA